MKYKSKGPLVARTLTKADGGTFTLLFLGFEPSKIEELIRGIKGKKKEKKASKK